MDEDTCDCPEHGVQPITFVCNHITSTPLGETVGFVSYAPEGPDDLRDAWCDSCDAFLQEHGGYWEEGQVEVPGGVTIICGACYRRREAEADQARRRKIYRIS